MRIAGNVSKTERLEVDYIKSVHMVSRWVHEMFDPQGSAYAVGQGGGAAQATPPVDTRRSPA